MFFQSKIKVMPDIANPIDCKIGNFTPFKDIIKLLKKDKNYMNFQIIFMIGGFALMFISPALYNFFIDLKLTNQDMINAFYQAAGADSSIRLDFFTGLSLNPPKPATGLKQRFLGPFVQRFFETFFSLISPI